MAEIAEMAAYPVFARQIEITEWLRTSNYLQSKYKISVISVISV